MKKIIVVLSFFVFCFVENRIYDVTVQNQIFFWRDGWICEDRQKPAIELYTLQGESWIMFDAGHSRHLSIVSDTSLESGDILNLETSEATYWEGNFSKKETHHAVGSVYVLSVTPEQIWVLLWAETAPTEKLPSRWVFGIRPLKRNVKYHCNPHPEPVE